MIVYLLIYFRKEPNQEVTDDNSLICLSHLFYAVNVINVLIYTVEKNHTIHKYAIYVSSH